MSKTIRVGNLALATTVTRLEEICAEFGRVAKVRLAESPFSGKSRGFGIVEMKSANDAASCVAGLNEQERDGQKLIVVDATAEETKRYIRRR